MIEYLGKKYIPADEDFLARPSFEVAPRLIGCILHHNNRNVDTAIMLIENEAYGGGNDRAFHLHPENRSRRNGSVSTLMPHGHVRIHGYGSMWALDIICGKESPGSTVLIRAGLPVVGIGVMAERRSIAPDADRDVRNRANGFEKKLCNGPCKVSEALGIYPLLDGASLFVPPFRLLRPVEPVATLLNGPRVNVTQDIHLPWRWGHPEYRAWLSPQPFPKKDSE